MSNYSVFHINKSHNSDSVGCVRRLTQTTIELSNITLHRNAPLIILYWSNTYSMMWTDITKMVRYDRLLNAFHSLNLSRHFSYQLSVISYQYL